MARYFKTTPIELVEDGIFQPNWELAKEALLTQDKKVQDNLDEIEFLRNPFFMADEADEVTRNQIIKEVENGINDITRRWQHDILNPGFQRDIIDFRKNLTQRYQYGDISKIQQSAMNFMDFETQLKAWEEKDPYVAQMYRENILDPARKNYNGEHFKTTGNVFKADPVYDLRSHLFERFLASPKWTELREDIEKDLIKDGAKGDYIIRDWEKISGVNKERILGAYKAWVKGDPSIAKVADFSEKYLGQLWKDDWGNYEFDDPNYEPAKQILGLENYAYRKENKKEHSLKETSGGSYSGGGGKGKTGDVSSGNFSVGSTINATISGDRIFKGIMNPLLNSAFEGLVEAFENEEIEVDAIDPHTGNYIYDENGNRVTKKVKQIVLELEPSEEEKQEYLKKHEDLLRLAESQSRTDGGYQARKRMEKKLLAEMPKTKAALTIDDLVEKLREDDKINTDWDIISALRGKIENRYLKELKNRLIETRIESGLSEEEYDVARAVQKKEVDKEFFKVANQIEKQLNRQASIRHEQTRATTWSKVGYNDEESKNQTIALRNFLKQFSSNLPFHIGGEFLNDDPYSFVPFPLKEKDDRKKNKTTGMSKQDWTGKIITYKGEEWIIQPNIEFKMDSILPYLHTLEHLPATADLVNKWRQASGKEADSISKELFRVALQNVPLHLNATLTLKRLNKKAHRGSTLPDEIPYETYILFDPKHVFADSQRVIEEYFQPKKK